MGISVAQSCEAALSYYHKAAKKGTLLILQARMIYTDPLHDTVVDKVTLITGGLLISKVRLMEEDNEVQMYGTGYCIGVAGYVISVHAGHQCVRSVRGRHDPLPQCVYRQRQHWSSGTYMYMYNNIHVNALRSSQH